MLRSMGFIFISVGFFLVGGSYLTQVGIDYGFSYRTIYYMQGGGWSTVAAGMLTLAIAELLASQRKP